MLETDVSLPPLPHRDKRVRTHADENVGLALEWPSMVWLPIRAYWPQAWDDDGGNAVIAAILFKPEYAVWV